MDRACGWSPPRPIRSAHSAHSPAGVPSVPAKMGRGRVENVEQDHRRHGHRRLDVSREALVKFAGFRWCQTGVDNEKALIAGVAALLIAASTAHAVEEPFSILNPKGIAKGDHADDWICGLN